MNEVVNIARCPEHGLHGRRETCFECGAPVKQVPMVPLADAQKLEGERDEARATARERGDLLETVAEARDDFAHQWGAEQERADHAIAHHEAFKERLTSEAVVEIAAEAEWESDEARSEVSTAWRDAPDRIRDEYREDMAVALTAAIKAAEEQV